MTMETSRVGKYELTGDKFSGGMGTVYVGLDPVLNRSVAVKVLHKHLSDQSGFTQRFIREAQILARLKHHNITQVYEAGECDEGLYLAMEYVEGETLEDCIFKGKYRDAASALPIIKQVCAALDYAHAQGIIHRDIKPSNIMIKPNGEAMLMDFGIAKMGGASGVTQDGTALGTPQYMSAEQCKGLPIDHRSDIYSLAIVVYEMLTGSRPFEGENLFSIINKQITNTPAPITVKNVAFSGGISSAISRALSKDPNARQQSATEFYNSLVTGRGKTLRTGGRKPTLLYVAAGVALSGLVGISLMLWSMMSGSNASGGGGGGVRVLPGRAPIAPVNAPITPVKPVVTPTAAPSSAKVTTRTSTQPERPVPVLHSTATKSKLNVPEKPAHTRKPAVKILRKTRLFAPKITRWASDNTKKPPASSTPPPDDPLAPPPD